MSIDMPTVELKFYPDPILKTKCHDIDPNDPDLPAVLDKMVAIMFAYNGSGIAAPQVGLPWNVFIVDLGPNEDPRVLVNPKLELKEGTLVESDEACLSLPGIKGKVERHNQILISCCAPKSEERVTITLYGREARIFQHEYDHLQGIVYLDRMKPVAKRMARTKYLKHKDEILTLRKQNQELRLKSKDIQKFLAQYEKKPEDGQDVLQQQDSSVVNECNGGPVGDVGLSGVSPEQTAV